MGEKDALDVAARPAADGSQSGADVTTTLANPFVASFCLSAILGAKSRENE